MKKILSSFAPARSIAIPKNRITAPGSPVAELPSSKRPPSRVISIDLLRGAIMIIMALDHARGFLHRHTIDGFNPLDLTTTSPVLFFTRWITHYCAPNFIFIAGLSIFLSGRRKTKNELSRFLFTRGLWLMLIELTLVHFSFDFGVHYHFFGLGVIWVIGLSMVCLSALIFLPKAVLIILCLLLVFGHNLLDLFTEVDNNFAGFVWSVLHVPHHFQIGEGYTLEVLYVLLPWLGLMMAGYLAGQVFSSSFDASKRRKILLLAGGGGLVLFVLLRTGNLYGDPSPWHPQASPVFTFLSFINVTKYPPSLLYMLVTVGPALLFLAFAEKNHKILWGWLSKKISVIGRVPFFYYVLHLYLLNFFALIVLLAQGFHFSNLHPETDNHLPKGMGLPLWQVYGLWLLAVLLLYPLCMWFDHYKTAHKDKWWLSYL